MKISLLWLKTLLPGLKASSAAIEKKLTNLGLEVEGVHAEAEALEGVVLGEVKVLAPHPQADNLRVAQLFDGQTTHTVVCGAPNVAQGQKVAYAPVGTTLPNGMTLLRKSIRGVESAGMICSAAELGLSDDADGIMVFESRQKAGRPLAAVLGLQDVIFELSVTPNRPDALSHLGIARELAAAFDLEAALPKAKLKEGKKAAASLAKLELKESARCGRYLGRVITGVKVGPSPEWVLRRLRAIGVRSISNVVDATNLVLFELGHPLHAFDLDRLAGQKIVVRLAQEGEKLRFIDGKERALDPDDLVIADEKAPVALAGVMGGQDSEVGDATQNILLESAYFDPKGVRRGSKRHGLHTEASHRFERGADIGIVEAALDRCAELIVSLAGGQVAKGKLSAGKKAAEGPVVRIRPERASLMLGRPVDKKEVVESLGRLGLLLERGPAKAKTKKVAPSLAFRVPSWRVDLNREVDLIEEVARLGGYDTIPTVMPPVAGQVWTSGVAPNPETEARHCLVGLGYLEAVSLAFTSVALAEAMRLPVAQGVYVANPLGAESQLMRMSLLPALLDAARRNQSSLPAETNLRLFELGRTFEWTQAEAELPQQALKLAILARGRREPVGWAGTNAGFDFYDLKGAVERLLERFRIRSARFRLTERAWLHPRSATEIVVGDQVVGVMGEGHPDLAQRFELEGPPVFLAELDVALLEGLRGRPAPFVPLPKLPPAQRDLSFYLPREHGAAEVLDAVRASAGSILESVSLFDVYEGKGVPEGQKSLALALTFRADRTLTDAEVASAQTAIVEAVEARFSARLRTA